MSARETTFGSPSGEPSITTTRPMTQEMCEKSWTLPILANGRGKSLSFNLRKLKPSGEGDIQ